jgi:hypothetical protein
MAKSLDGRIAFGLAVLVGGASGCEQVKRVEGDAGECVPAEVQAAFERSCGGASCHVGGAAGGLSLSANDAGAIVGKTAVGSTLPLVEIGNTAGSYMAQKLIGAAEITGDPMPPTGTGTDDARNDVNTILTWIGGGVFECDAGTGTGDTDTTGGPMLRSCGLADLNPAAPNPIVAGTGAMQIPPDIATILADNCGCHYTNEFPTPPPYIDYLEGSPSQPLDMATWAGFQALKGTVPYHAVTLDRVNGGPPIAMPPPDPNCAAMPADQTATLVQWLEMGAPDGATWMGAPQGGEHVCGIEDLKPGAPNPIQSGTGAGQIPPDIASILANNCGCHYADDLEAMIPDYSGTIDIATHAGFQAPFFGGPALVHERVLDYVASEFMPFSDDCLLSDGKSKIAADDMVLLMQWLVEGAPDGATWSAP